MPEKTVMRQMAAPHFKASVCVTSSGSLSTENHEHFEICKRNPYTWKCIEFTGNVLTSVPTEMAVLIGQRRRS